MIRKLNNKGLTAVELLVCFALVSLIIISMTKAINSYRNKQEFETFKTSINTYKNTLTKAIYDNIMKNGGVINASTVQNLGDPIQNPSETYKSTNFGYTLTLSLASGKTSTIEIYSNSKCITYSRNSSGKRVESTNQVCGNDDELNIDYKNSNYYVDFTDTDGFKERYELPKLEGLHYNEILAEKRADGFVNIHIGLWHNDYGSSYDVLNIILPDVSTYPEMF